MPQGSEGIVDTSYPEITGNEQDPNGPVVVADEPPSPEDGGEGADKFFLKVNDRTAFKTAEDAIRSFEEAGNRIGSLSQWEKFARQHGINTPEEMVQVFSEAFQARQRPKSNAQDGAKPDAAETEFKPEEKQAIDFLKKAGFLTADQIADMRAQLDVSNRTVQEQEQRELESRVDEGRTELHRLFKEKGYVGADGKLDPELQESAEAIITNWLNSVSLDPASGKAKTDSPLYKLFYGTRAERDGVVAEGFSRVMRVLERGTAKTAARVEATRTTNTGRTTNVARPPARPGAPAAPAGPSLQDRAFALFQKVAGRPDGDE